MTENNKLKGSIIYILNSYGGKRKLSKTKESRAF